MKFNFLLSRQTLLPLMLALPPVFAIVAGKFLFEVLAFDFPDLGARVADYFLMQLDHLPPATALLETKARLLWLTSVLLYLCLCIGFVVFLSNTLKKTAAERLWIPILIAAMLSCAEVFYLLQTESAQSPIKTLFHFTFDALAASSLLSSTYLIFIQYTLELINVLSIIIAPLTIVTCCCFLCQPTTQIDQLGIRFEWLKKLVEFASAVMIVGIIHMQLWLSWPLSLMPSYGDIKPLKEIVMVVIQYWGISYTLTIAALYIPSSAYLRNRALAIHGQMNVADKTKELPSWLGDTQGVQAIGNKIPQLAAILAPMVVGSISPSMTELFAF